LRRIFRREAGVHAALHKEFVKTANKSALTRVRRNDDRGRGRGPCATLTTAMAWHWQAARVISHLTRIQRADSARRFRDRQFASEAFEFGARTWPRLVSACSLARVDDAASDFVRQMPTPSHRERTKKRALFAELLAARLMPLGNPGGHLGPAVKFRAP